jgi:orotidine-5'-phosphate decarboxylase
MSFGARSAVAMQAYGPLCVGIDPHAELLEQWGVGDTLDGLKRFADTCVEAFAGRVAFVKPQSAFFERFGSAGIEVLEETMQNLRHTGTLVILDVKRGDIGSTAKAYAQAYLRENSPVAADAITVSPFLGFGSLEPFFAEAEKNDAGVFVLALTSNPEGPQVQHARANTSESVAGQILRQLAAANAGLKPMGPLGAVVGATIGDLDEDVDINGPLLVPGFGAQGGTVDDLRRLFGHVWDRTIPTTSRGVLSQGPDAAALVAAAESTNEQLR